MPELPEVHVMMQKLRGWSERTRMVTSVDVHSATGKYLTTGRPEGEQSLEGIFQRGKLLIFQLSSGTLVCHNAMSGFWDVTDQPWTFDYVEGRRGSRDTDVRVSITLRNRLGDEVRTLRFHDARKFGSLLFYPTKQWLEIPSVRRVAIEAWFVESAEHFGELLTRGSRKRRVVKDVLMDQSVVSGLGNIYAAEVLWTSKVRPDRIVGTLEDYDIHALWRNSRDVLRAAVDRKLDYSGLNIYRRRNCPKCGSPVQRMDIKGRSTYFCGTCQR